jgi:hypothetical protein
MKTPETVAGDRDIPFASIEYISDNKNEETIGQQPHNNRTQSRKPTVSVLPKSKLSETN